MHAIVLALAALLPCECKECQANGAGASTNGRPAPAAVRCPNYTPPVRWYCKRCAGCAGEKCLACQSPYFGSAPYNYRVQFDYPWSQQPAYRHHMMEPEAFLDGEEVPAGPEVIEYSSRKAKVPYKTTRTK
jgi:hypothetical protein